MAPAMWHQMERKVKDMSHDSSSWVSPLQPLIEALLGG
jgi:hypothetical protein